MSVGSPAVSEAAVKTPIETPSFSFGDLQLVGHGKITNDRCGTWSSVILGCLRTDLHNLVTVHGENYRNRVPYKRFKNSCDKPSCQICKHQWAVRQAFRMEARLKEASKRFGQVEHIMISIPQKDYGLSYRVVMNKIKQVLYRCNVIGGCRLPHSLRFDDDRRVWYFSPHLHILGFIAGGYRRCRRCKGGDCYTCDGIEGKLYREYRKSRYIVRIFGERETVGGTAVYELEHATMNYSKKRLHIVTWFGVCSYRKMKFTPEKRKALCPICQHELVRLSWVGRKKLSELGKDGVEDLTDADGRLQWVEVDARKRYGER